MSGTIHAMNVTILYGGRSTEHEVSLVSAAGVYRAMRAIPEITVQLVGITREGRWYLQDPGRQDAAARDDGTLMIETRPEDTVVIAPAQGLAVSSITGDGRALPTDCVFPVLHGSYGEDGTIQGLLEIADLPYVGSGVTGSAVGMDKLRAKQLWQQNGLPVVPYCVVREGFDLDVVDTLIRDQLEYPVFVKPNAAGSSIGISRVSNGSELDTALSRALPVDSTILVEKAFPVREIETAVLGNTGPRTFPPGEVIPSHEFYDYDAKYTDPDGARLVIPAVLDATTEREIRDICARAYLAVDASGLSRVDSFIHRETGMVYLNEINTIPGFTPISMYPKMVEHGGLTYRELIIELVRLALERSEHRYRRDFHAR